MDGRNCNGRKISLLNDSKDTAIAFNTSRIQLPPLTAHSRASSCASTPSLSPQTPQLIRSSSSDSRSFQTPSPLTPSFNSFDQSVHEYPHKSQQHSYYYFSHHQHTKMDDQNAASLYPPIPDATGAMPSAYPMPPQMAQMPPQPMQQAYRSSNSPASEPSRVSTVSATSNAKSQPKKNQYPCPMAKQYGCTDFFTTSGHAARHAKKHTGKKDAFCPECNKAFTRKDNMEQHRRTHQNGRGGSRTATSDDAKVKKPTKSSAKKTAVKVEQPQVEAAIEQELAEQQQPIVAPTPIQAPMSMSIHMQQTLPQALLDQTLMMPPNGLPQSGPYFLNTVDTGPVPALPMAMPDLAVRPPLQRSDYTNSLEYVAPAASMVADPDALHYSYPSPGLSNGLNSLAFAASEHRRLSEEKSSSLSPQETPSQETPSETP